MSLWIAPIGFVLLVLWGYSYDVRRFVSERQWRRDERRMQTMLDREAEPYAAMTAQLDEVRGLPEAPPWAW